MDTKPAADDFPELVPDVGHVCEPSGVVVEIEVTALPLSSPAHPHLAGTGDDYELGFALPPDASPAFECLVPELALAITATGAIDTKAGVRLVDADRKRVPVTAYSWQHF